MLRFLAMLMIVALVIGHGGSYAAAICHHQNAEEHALARLSHDGPVAAKALSEETAASVASKEATGLSASPSAWAADMLPNQGLVAPFRIFEPIRTPIVDQARLASRSVPPQLEPPAA